MNYLRLNKTARTLHIVASLLLFISCISIEARAQANAARTPTETVREFYRLLRERHFREAFAISIYKPAIEGLTDQEFDDLRPEFERMASSVPDNITISGEQVDRKSTRLNSSHSQISYAVFCLKK